MSCHETFTMRTLLIFTAISCLLVVTSGKPLRTIEDQNRDEGEAEYENKEESTAEDYPQDDQEASVESQDGARNNPRRGVAQENSRLPDISNNPYKQNVHNFQTMQLANIDNFSEMSGTSRDVRIEKSPNANTDTETRPIRLQQSDTYVENIGKEAKQHYSDNNFKSNRGAQGVGYENTMNKRAMLSAVTNDEGDLLFDNNKDQLSKINKLDGGMQSRYYNQLYNVPVENREFPDYRKYEKLRLNINRDRRQAQKTSLKESNVSTPSSGDSKELDTINEDEETAIKRHVKKLSGQELEELFNTLSEEKRNLLKKIIETDTDNEYEALTKREITKKAGAVDQNNYIENVQLDSNKVQEVSSNDEDITEPSVTRETTEANKRTMSVTEINDVVHSKNSPGCEKSENKHELTNQNEDVKEVKSESNIDLDSKKSNNDMELESNSQTIAKNENKREANVSEMIDIGKSSEDSQTANSDYNAKDFESSLNNQETFLHDDKISEFMNEETERQSSYKNNCKRDVTSSDESSEFSDSIKSLEESFPNSYGESNSFSGSDMAPLVRVKRKDAESAIMKRAANVIADSNVPYFPNKGENDDEDNDEGSEFDEDGFYDRTSNYARNNDNNKPLESHCEKSGDRILTQNSGLNSYGNENSESETVNLGSDTDNVMTSVEGVNDNLMYSSGLRNRRTSEDNDNDNSSEKLKDMSNERKLRSTPLVENEAKAVSETFVNVPGYQENDAFGPLPRNYEGDLGRYKRIRRVKQPSMFQENIPNA